MAKKWMNRLDLKKGALRKSLHVKSGQPIPEGKLRSAEHSKNPKTRKRAVLAETFRKVARRRSGR